jgi:hypothetical protein
MADGNALRREIRLARAIAETVRSVPGIADIRQGQFAEIATYGPGDKVPGIVLRVTPEGAYIEVHVSALYSDGLVLSALATQVRSAVRQAVEVRDPVPLGQIDVVFDDLRVP